MFAVVAGDLNHVGSGPSERKASRKIPGARQREIQRGLIVEKQPGRAGRPAQTDSKVHVGPLERRNIALVLHDLGRHFRIGRKTVGEIDPLRCSQVDNLHGISPGTHSLGFDVVLKRRTDVDEQIAEYAAQIRRHCRRAPDVGGFRLQKKPNVRRIETDELGLDLLVGAFRDLHIAGLDPDHDRSVQGRLRPGSVEAVEPETKKGWPPGQERKKRGKCGGAEQSISGEPFGLHEDGIVDPARFFQRILDQKIDQARRFPVFLSIFHRGDKAVLQLRMLLLDKLGDLHVAEPDAQRQIQKPPGDEKNDGRG